MDVRRASQRLRHVVAGHRYRQKRLAHGLGRQGGAGHLQAAVQQHGMDGIGRSSARQIGGNLHLSEGGSLALPQRVD